MVSYGFNIKIKGQGNFRVIFKLQKGRFSVNTLSYKGIFCTIDSIRYRNQSVLYAIKWMKLLQTGKSIRI